MYFIASEDQEIVAIASSFLPSEPSLWEAGDKVQFDIDRVLRADKICVCSLTGQLRFILIENFSIAVGENSEGLTVSGVVTEVGAGNPQKVGAAIKKYMTETEKTVRIDYELISDLENSAFLPEGINGIILKLLHEGKRVKITGASDGEDKEVVRDASGLRLVKFE